MSISLWYFAFLILSRAMINFRCYQVSLLCLWTFWILFPGNTIDGCTLPSTLTTSDWVYTKSGSSTTVSFSQDNIMTGISYNARGSILNSYKCILNTMNVYVFKSTKSYSEFGITRWLYLCMKLTKVSDNLFYFYLLADVDTDLGDRVLAPPAAISDTDPTCEYCQYTTPPADNEIRTLQRKDTQETLPGGESPCLPCDAVCSTTEAFTTSTVSVLTSGETTTTSGKTTTTSGETTTEENSGCKLPGSLVGDWYDVKKNVNITFTPTKLINWPVVLTGSQHKDQTCIYNTNNVYVFRGDDKYDEFINFYYYYFCMKLTKVSDNLYYYYLLSDTNDPIANGERTYLPKDSDLPNDTCGYCRYTTEIPVDDYRLLQKIGTNESPSEIPTPCLPCEATCDLTTESIFASSTTERLNDMTSQPGSTDKDTTILTSSTTERLNDVTSQSGTTDKDTSIFASSTTDSSKSVTSQSGSTDKDTATMTYSTSNYISTDGFQYSSTTDKPTTTYTSVVITSQNEDTSVIDTTIVKTSLDASSTSDGRTSSKLSTTSTATTTLSVLKTTTKDNANTNGAASAYNSFLDHMLASNRKTNMIYLHTLLLTVGMALLVPVNCDAECKLPSIIQNSQWIEDQTNVEFTFGTSTLSGPSVNARGTQISTYSCISIIEGSDTDDNLVVVFKSRSSYTDRGRVRRIYLCMKITILSENLLYFYLLSDIDTSIVPNYRVFNPPPGQLPPDSTPTCSFCKFTTAPPDSDFQLLKRKGTTEYFDSSSPTLCLPCDKTTCREIITTTTTTESLVRCPNVEQICIIDTNLDVLGLLSVDWSVCAVRLVSLDVLENEPCSTPCKSYAQFKTYCVLE